MKFTDSEMIFFNSLLDGKAIFGLNIKRPILIDDEYASRTIQGLTKKGLIGEDGKLADVRPNPIMQLEYFKNSPTHISYNNLILGLSDAKSISGVAVHDDGYEIFSCEKSLYMFEMFLNTPFLNERMEDYPTSMETDTDKDDFLAHMSSNEYEHCVVFRKYSGTDVVREYTFLWNSQIVLFFDGMDKKKREVNGVQARALLLELFELDVLTVKGGNGDNG